MSFSPPHSVSLGIFAGSAAFHLQPSTVEMPPWAPRRPGCDETRPVPDKCGGAITAETLLSCHLPFSP